MNILFIHQNFPGQFKHLAPALEMRGHVVRAVGLKSGQISKNNPINTYKISRGNSIKIHPLVLEYETKIIRAEACTGALIALRDNGFIPNLIVAHPGWGESQFAKFIYPRAKQLHFCEFYYSNRGADVGFDPEFKVDSLISKIKTDLKNTILLTSLNQMDRGYSPTNWQKSLFPKQYEEKIEVVFDGIDTTVVTPGLPDPRDGACKFDAINLNLKDLINKDVITFVNRNLEPYRGYHSFMRALPLIQKACPNAIILIVGGEGTSYGSSPKFQKSWKEIFLDEVRGKLDLSTIYFLGNIPYQKYLNVLKVSKCHVYLTYPFVLSWSCLEAMSSECIVIGSKTSPVEEVITDGENGILVDFFDVRGIANRVIDVLLRPERYKAIKKAARQTIVERYDLKKICLPKQIQLIEQMISED